MMLFTAAFRANIAAGEDFISANLFVQGFDPGLEASARINEQVNEIRVETQFAVGTISTFTEQIFATAGNDSLIGSPGTNANTTFISIQGKSLGGVDKIDGGAGTDELSLRNLSDILLIATAPSGNFILEYSDQSGSITGTITTINIDQAFAVAARTELANVLQRTD